MNRHPKLNFLLWAALASAWPVAPAASEIFHWVDADGTHHYSQSPPPDTPDSAETLHVDGSQPASYNPDEDIYDVAAQAEATQAVWDKMAESRKNRQTQPSAAENTIIDYPHDGDRYDTIVYPNYGSRPGHHPGYRPRPPDNPVKPPDFLPEVPARPIRPGRP